MKRLRIFAALALCFSVSIAHADQADDAFAEGQKLAEQGKLKEAEAAFETAFAKRQAWDISGNLGLVEAAQSEWTDAADHLQFALDHIGSLARPDHKAGLEKKRDEVMTHVASLTFKGADVGGATITVNGKPVSKLGIEAGVAHVEPGVLAIHVEKPGFEPFDTTMKAEPGSKIDVPVELKAKPGGAGGGGTGGGDVVGPGGPGGEGDPPEIWPGALLLGVGAVGIAVGIAGVAEWGVHQGNAEDIVNGLSKGACFADHAPCDGIDDELSSANAFAVMGIIGLAIGVPSMVVGGVLIGSSLDAADAADGGAEPAPVSVSVQPMMGRVNGLVLEGRWQ